ncbi:glycosyltransferase [Polynucleobacter paneuropaeus]|nr:glycosyltransferase [Polynucleobacter paneuropaeus]MBT8605269.1 glycosyltransferase [Polynucleobacter paneuropaeus]
MADVTVLIPVRNGRDYVEFAIDSVLKQSYQKIRLVVSDNGSSDGTIEIIERLRTRYDFDFFLQDGSLSMLEHFNLCIEYVDSPYYMLLCHDDRICEHDAIAEAIHIISEHPEISAIYSNMLYVDEIGRIIAKKKFKEAGLFNGYRTGIDSILSMRNLYGIPLLVSKNSLSLHRYQLNMPYVADVELALFLATQGDSYRIDKYLLENRFHSSNSTKGLYVGTLKQMKKLAETYSIELGILNRVRMYVMAIAIAFAKYIFFQYLLLRGYLRNPKV